jgi:prolyl-tRNA editing enzyme YbaK/EbsC (Cys-tRNA(Pro) deacylase)
MDEKTVITAQAGIQSRSPRAGGEPVHFSEALGPRLRGDDVARRLRGNDAAGAEDVRCADDGNWPEGVQRVAKALQAHGHPHTPLMLDDAARTAQQAADQLGIAVGQIAKSIIFRRKSDDAAVLVITSGDRRVDEKKVAALVGEGRGLGRADADFVKSRTGYSIGGVSPIAHAQPPVTLIDRELFRFEEIWAAAGHPHGVFKLRPHDLERLTGAPVADVVQQAAGA